MGYSFGRPVITKTADQGWVVLVSSGYNNTRTVERSSKTGIETATGDGQGHLFVLNARTGEVIEDIPTGAGTTDDPAGLAAFSAYIDNAAIDNMVTQVHAGDFLKYPALRSDPARRRIGQETGDAGRPERQLSAGDHCARTC